MKIAIATLCFGLLIFSAHLFAALFERTKFPDVLPLILIGLLLGPVFDLAQLEDFGAVDNVFTAIALVVILFEGGIKINIKEIQKAIVPGARLTLINYFITLNVVCLVAMLTLDLTFIEGIILGSILSGTSSAVVLPLISRLNILNLSKTTLFIESAASDVLTIVVTLGLITAVLSQSVNPGIIIGQILASFILASIIGCIAAVFWSSVLPRIRQLDNSIFLTPAIVCILYGVNELLGYSGAIAALAFGTVLGNICNLNIPLFQALIPSQPEQFNQKEREFFAEVVFLLKTFFFIVIGISIRLTSVKVFLTSLLIVVSLFLARIFVVHLSLSKDNHPFDASIAAIMIPKGLAAAVLSNLPLQANIESGMLIRDTTYGVILFSILMTSALVFLMETTKLKEAYRLCFPGFALRSAALVSQTAEPLPDSTPHK